MLIYKPGLRTNKGIKINANENFYFNDKNILLLINLYKNNIYKINIYPDSNLFLLKNIIKNKLKLSKNNIFICNGSDEGLGFLFILLKKKILKKPIYSYPFYNIYCNFNKIINKNVNYKNILKYKNIIFSNPNSPTNEYKIKNQIIKNINKNEIILIDEAYADFSGIDYSYLINKKNNLIIIKTFSKSYSLANIRIGFIISNKNIIKKLNNIKYCFNSYTVSSLNSYIAAECFQNYDKLIINLQKVNFSLYYLYNFFNKKIKIFFNYSNFLLLKVNIDFFIFFKKKNIFLRKFKINNNHFIRITIPNIFFLKKILKLYNKWS